MQKREQTLLIVLGASVAFVFVLPVFESLLLAPFQSRNNRLTELREEVESKERKENQLLVAKAQLRDWAAEALPPDPLNAQRVYAEWLVDLARLSGLRKIEPNLGNRTPAAKIYTAIPVTITAEATLKELATFLFHFERTKLLQRIIKCDVVSPETEGNPLLKVTLTAEGLSLPDAPERLRLFPRAQLAASLDGSQTQLKVDSATGFPQQGTFRVRIDREFALVTARQGTDWTLTRGIDATAAAPHDKDAIVELAPVAPPSGAPEKASIEAYTRLLEAGPFVKPRPPVVYRPQLASVPNQTVIRGRPLTLTVRVTGWDPLDGPPLFELGDDAPAGMQIDDDGRLIWSPGADVPAGDYPVTVLAMSELADSVALSTSFRVTLRDANLPPQIKVPAEIPVAWLGREWSLPVTAIDPDATGALTWSLTGPVPEGATVDPQSGLVRWAPPDSTAPGTIPITVQVADSGNPPQTASATVSVKVDDDAALFTYLVGCIRDGDRWTAWLYDRSTNQSRYLQPGSTFQVSDISGKVVSIDLKSMEFEDEEGRWRLAQEQPLRKAEPVHLFVEEPSKDTAPAESAAPAPTPAPTSTPSPTPTSDPAAPAPAPASGANPTDEPDREPPAEQPEEAGAAPLTAPAADTDSN